MAAWIGLTTLCYKPSEVPSLCRRNKEDTSDELETDNDSGVYTGTLKDGKTLEEVEVAEEDFQSESEVSNHRINNDDDDTQSNDMSSDPHVESPVVADDE